MIKAGRVAWGLAFIWLAGLGSPAPSAPPAAAPPAGCELHIFPVQFVTVNDATQNSMGGLLPALINDAFRVKSPDEIVKFIRSAVSQEDEVELLRGFDYSGTLKGRGLSIVVHDTFAASDALVGSNYKTSPPVLDETPGCYRELVLNSFYYEKGTMHKAVKTVYFYREFTGRAQSRKARLGVEGHAIANFPPDDEEEAKAARAALREIYVANLTDILNKK